MSLATTCPGAELEHGVVSLNEQDVRCRLTGMIRAVEDSPCCGEYTRCAIWRGEKQRLWKHKREARAGQMIGAGSGEWS